MKKPPESGWRRLGGWVRSRSAKPGVGMRWAGILLRAALVLVAALAGTYYVLTAYSVTQTALKCSGSWELASPNWEGRTETVYAVLEEYQPWVLWASDGNLSLDTSEFGLSRYVPYVQKIDRGSLSVYAFRHSRDEKDVGLYHSATKEFSFWFSDTMMFSGTCQVGF